MELFREEMLLFFIEQSFPKQNKMAAAPTTTHAQIPIFVFVPRSHPDHGFVARPQNKFKMEGTMEGKPEGKFVRNRLKKRFFPPIFISMKIPVIYVSCLYFKM